MIDCFILSSFGILFILGILFIGVLGFFVNLPPPVIFASPKILFTFKQSSIKKFQFLNNQFNTTWYFLTFALFII